MRVLSVNLAKPRVIEVRDKRVSTGIYKEPTPGVHRIDTLGIALDTRVDPRSQFGEADHAVYLYPHEHYVFWQRFLERSAFPYGQFGENLTVTGLLETEVHMGDILRVGTSVLQVAQPRIPCRKLNVRMGFKLARIFLESRRVGFYMRVLTPGEVQAGSSIELLERDTRSPTMDAFVRLSQHDYWDAVGLESLIERTRDLNPAWRVALSEKLARARGTDGWLGLRELQVVSRIEEGEDVVTFELRCSEGRALPPFKAGQHMTVALRRTPMEGVTRRAYALSGSPFDTTTYRVTLERLRGPTPDAPDGIVSAFLHEHLNVGDRVRVAAPRGNFTLEAASPEHEGLLFIGYGIAVAPFLSMLEQWGATAEVPARVFCFGAPGKRHTLERRLKEAAKAFPRLELWFGEALGGELEFSRIHAVLSERCWEVFVAGRNQFVDAIRARLQEAGYERGRVHTERFG